MLILDDLYKKLKNYENLNLELKSSQLPSENQIQSLNSRIKLLLHQENSLKQDLIIHQQKLQNLSNLQSELQNLEILNSNQLHTKNELCDKIANFYLKLQDVNLLNQDLIIKKEEEQNSLNKLIGEKRKILESVENKRKIFEEFEKNLSLMEDKLKKAEFEYSECCEREEILKGFQCDYEIQTKKLLEKMESLITEKHKLFQANIKGETKGNSNMMESVKASCKANTEFCKVCGFPKVGKIKLCKMCKVSVHIKCTENQFCRICVEKSRVC